jgi:hypothetical protein
MKTMSANNQIKIYPSIKCGAMLITSLFIMQACTPDPPENAGDYIAKKIQGEKDKAPAAEQTIPSEISLTPEQQNQLKTFQEKWAKEKIDDFEGYITQYDITSSSITFYLGKGASENGTTQSHEDNRLMLQNSYAEAAKNAGIQPLAINIEIKPMKNMEKVTGDYKALGLTPVGTTSLKIGLKLYTIKSGKAIYSGEITSINLASDKVTITPPQGGQKTIDGGVIDEDYFVKVQHETKTAGWYPAENFLIEGNEGKKLYQGVGGNKTFYGTIQSIEPTDDKTIITISLSNGEIEFATKGQIKREALYISSEDLLSN